MKSLSNNYLGVSDFCVRLFFAAPRLSDKPRDASKDKAEQSLFSVMRFFAGANKK